MKRRLKKGLILILFSILILNSFLIRASAPTNIIVNQPQSSPTPQKQGWFSSYFGFLTSPLFWGAMVFLLLIGILIICVYAFIKWLIKFFKYNNDIYYQAFKIRVKMARLHSQYIVRHWLKTSKNTPIRLIRMINGKPQLSHIIAYCKGNYTTQEGTINIACNLIGDKKLFFFPNMSLIVIPDKESIIYEARDEKQKPIKKELFDIPRAFDIIQYNPNEILIYAESISQNGFFHFPVLRSKDNKIINLTMPIYKTMKDVAISEYLYEQSSEFINVNKKTIDMNPHIRAEVKTKDTNNSVEVQGGNPQQ